MSEFEWDEQKAEANGLKHGVGFNDAALALMGLTLTQPSRGYGEVRFSSICRAGERVILVVWTPRAGAIRIISARSARTDERARFDQAIRGESHSG